MSSPNFTLSHIDRIGPWIDTSPPIALPSSDSTAQPSFPSFLRVLLLNDYPQSMPLQVYPQNTTYHDTIHRTTIDIGSDQRDILWVPGARDAFREKKV